MATEKISSSIIANDAVSTDQIANNASISTSGNIATTGSGTLTVAGTTNLASVATGTLASAVVFPTGVFNNVNSLIQKVSSGNGRTHDAAGSGEQIIEYSHIVTNTDDSAFTQNILSLSSYYFTLNTGYYYWQTRHTQYGPRHAHSLGLRTYGASNGTGTTLGNVTTTNVNLGSIMAYTNDTSACLMENSGIVKVTSTSQKYGMYIHVQDDLQASWSTVTYSGTHEGILTKADFWKIG